MFVFNTMRFGIYTFLAFVATAAGDDRESALGIRGTQDETGRKLNSGEIYTNNDWLMIRDRLVNEFILEYPQIKFPNPLAGGALTTLFDLLKSQQVITGTVLDAVPPAVPSFTAYLPKGNSVCGDDDPIFDALGFDYSDGFNDLVCNFHKQLVHFFSQPLFEPAADLENLEVRAAKGMLLSPTLPINQEFLITAVAQTQGVDIPTAATTVGTVQALIEGNAGPPGVPRTYDNELLTLESVNIVVAGPNCVDRESNREVSVEVSSIIWGDAAFEWAKNSRFNAKALIKVQHALAMGFYLSQIRSASPYPASCENINKSFSEYLLRARLRFGGRALVGYFYGHKLGRNYSKQDPEYCENLQVMFAFGAAEGAYVGPCAAIFGFNMAKKDGKEIKLNDLLQAYDANFEKIMVGDQTVCPTPKGCDII